MQTPIFRNIPTFDANNISNSQINMTIEVLNTNGFFFIAASEINDVNK